MSMKAGGNRKPGGGGGGSSSSISGGASTTTTAAAAPGAGGGSGGGGGRHNLGRGRHSGKGPSAAVVFNGVYANMRMVHVLTSVVGTKCELKVKNGAVYEGVFKTYGPECDLVLDAAHRKSPEPVGGPRKEDIVESIIFKASDVVVVTFKDVDPNFARKVSSDADNFTDAAVSGRVNGEHKEKDLEPWDGGETHTSGSLESLDTDVSNGWDPNDMFKYNEEKYGVLSTYDSSLSTYTVPLERDNSEEFLKREARAAQLADEIEASSTYKARVALENDERSEEDKYTAVMRGERDAREAHALSRENKYIPPGQRNREALSWGAGRQNSPRLVQSSAGPPPPRPGAHDYSPSAGADQRVVNGGPSHWPSPCPSPSSRPPSRYQSGASFLPPRAATPTRPPSRPPSRPSRPSSHSSYPSYPSSSSSPAHHGLALPGSTLPKRMSSEGPPRMSPKSQRTPRAHRVPPCRTSAGVDYMSHNAPGEAPVTQQSRSSSSGGTWSSVVSGVHRPRSPRQNNMGGASPGPASLASPQAGSVPMEAAAPPPPASSPAAASPAPGMAASPTAEGKDSRVQETRQTSPMANKENIKPLDCTPSITRAVCKGPPSMAPDHRKQIDNLKKFSVDFRLQSSSNAEPVFDQMMGMSPRELGDKPKDLPLDKASSLGHEGGGDDGAAAAVGTAGATQGPPTTTATGSNASKPGSPAVPASSSSPSGADQKRLGPDVTSQGVQTSSPSTFTKSEDREEKKEAVQEQVKKSTLNPNAHEFKPRFNAQPKPANTPTPPRPQGQPSPSIVVQQPPAVYSQAVCFPQMYPLTPVSPGVQKSIIWKSPAMYHIQMPHMTVSQSKPYRPVPSMPQQRSEQHHPQGAPSMMHPVTAAAPPIVAQNPAYSAQYFTCSPQQFTSQPLVQQMPHYQSQAQHVFNPVMQGSARMMAPPTHGQPSLVSSSTTQYAEQTHTMYVSPGPMPQQYPHPSATLHPHPQHPQPSATPTGQAQQGGGQHGGPPSHPAASPVQHQQAAAAAAAQAQVLHMASQAPQQQMYSALAPTPPSMTPGPNPQSPQASFPSAQQTVYLHPQQVQHGYNPNHMAHVQQAHMQSGMVQSHHGAPGHPPMMLMATQGPGGPQPQMPQTALNPIPVSSTTHFSYLAHPQVQAHHQQQL